MKLEKILDQLNSFEKSNLLKIIEGLRGDKPKQQGAIEKLLSDNSEKLKDSDSQTVAKVFHLLSDEFSDNIKAAFLDPTSQVGILTDILIRDGNCIMKQDWLSRLYDKELKALKKKVAEFGKQLADEKSDLESSRRRDYEIYRACIETAYRNDEANNQEAKIIHDEQSILKTLSDKLELSNEEVRLLNFLVVPARQLDIDTIITELKKLGVILYSKKTNTVYIADEVVRILRRIKGKEVADKFFRRVLRQLREPQLNIAARKHNISTKLSFEEKVKEIINEGIGFSNMLGQAIHREGTTVTDRKNFLNELWSKKLNQEGPLKGATLEEKLASLVEHFEATEKDEKVGISIDGYERLLLDLESSSTKVSKFLKDEFELQEENVMKSDYLLDYNIKPKDLLEILPEDLLEKFCQKFEIKTRGDIVRNILDQYRDTENLYLENYVAVAFRDLHALKENGIATREAELGVLFEELSRKLFAELGFNVDEALRKKINSAKDKMDIVLSLDEGEIILVECKSVKEKGYNKFSSVARQLKSYIAQAEKKDLKVVKSLLVAPEFSDEFVRECGLDYELNLSLITASSLLKIHEAFKHAKLETFPYNLLMRDVLIQEDRIAKALVR